MRGRWMLCAACLTLALAGTQNAWAALQFYSDRAAFEAALGGFTKYTFEVADGFPETQHRIGPPSVLSSLDGGSIQIQGKWGSGYAQIADRYQPGPGWWPAPANRQFLGGVKALEFAGAPRAVGFEWVEGMVSIMVRVDLASGVGEPLLWRSPNHNQFFGVISDEPIQNIGIADPLGICIPYHGIDDLTISPMLDDGGTTLFQGVGQQAFSTVPEPGVLELLAWGALGLLSVRRRA